MLIGLWDADLKTDSQSSGDDEAAESTSEFAMSAFTDAMEKMNPVATGAGRVSPLTFQLKVHGRRQMNTRKRCVLTRI